MKKLNDQGFIGLLELGALVLLVALISFTAYRISSINSEVDRSLNNTADGSESTQKQPITLKEESEAKEVTVPEKEESKDQEPVTTETAKTTEPETTKPTIKSIKFTTRSASQDGNNVAASGTLESNQSGTCYFKFKQDGQEKVYKTSSISSSKSCTKTFAVSDFPVGGEWVYYVWFVSSDKTVQAYADTLTLSINK